MTKLTFSPSLRPPPPLEKIFRALVRSARDRRSGGGGGGDDDGARGFEKETGGGGGGGRVSNTRARIMQLPNHLGCARMQR